MVGHNVLPNGVPRIKHKTKKPLNKKGKKINKEGPLGLPELQNSSL